MLVEHKMPFGRGIKKGKYVTIGLFPIALFAAATIPALEFDKFRPYP